MKVWGGNFDGRHRMIVAARSKAAAARALGVTIGAMQYADVTANDEEVELAMREPGAVWKKSVKDESREWVLA